MVRYSGLASFFIEIDHKILPTVILASADSGSTVVSYWKKNVPGLGA